MFASLAKSVSAVSFDVAMSVICGGNADFAGVKTCQALSLSEILLLTYLGRLLWPMHAFCMLKNGRYQVIPSIPMPASYDK